MEKDLVKVLVLEDSEIDKKIIISTIEKSDLNFTIQIVDCKDDFIHAINDFKPDVVLSDYIMPNFDGMQALQIHKQHIPDVPFVFVTGKLSEETAIECLKDGAWDYIMKDHIKRLPVSIKNMLELKSERDAKKMQRQQLEESERRYKTLSELTFEGILLHNNGLIIDCNLSFCHMFGYSREELLNINFIDLLIHPSDRKRLKENIKNKVTAPNEFMAISKDGTIFPIEQETKTIEYNGEETRVVAVRDVTSRKQVLEAIKLSEEKFNKISNAAKDPIILMDHHGNVSFWNNAATEVFQYTEEEILGKNLHQMLAPEKYHEAHKTGFEKFLKTGLGKAIGEVVEMEARRKDGKIIPVELSLSAMKMDGNWNAVGIIRDITSRKKVESEMKQAQRHAEDMALMKTNFLSSMSHELRTPLNGILGFSEILLESLEEGDHKDYARTIFKSSQRILNTFNLIIDLAVLDANKVIVTRKPENIVNIVENACEAYLSEATEKHLYLNQQIEVDEAIAEIDQILLTQALNNLLNNAVKYTNSGGITVKLSEMKMQGTDCFVVSVIDTGIGIPKEKISIIYEAFRQASEGYNRAFEGLGLGLHITKKYVDLLEGLIEMESEVNKGTTFRIYFPKDGVSTLMMDKNSSGRSEEETKAVQHSEKARILYVEDDPDHRKFLEIFLKNIYDIKCAEDGKTALEMVKNTKFDLILMDINLGAEMNGLEVVEEIRKMDQYKNTPIAAVTANALVSQKNAYLSQGCTDYIAKPFKKKKIIDFINKILDAESTR